MFTLGLRKYAAPLGKRLIALSAALLSILAVTPAHADITIANSGFETPALAAHSFQYNPPGGSWTFTGYSGITSNGSDIGSGAVAPQGVQTAFVQETGYCTQSLSGFQSGVTYTLTFGASQRDGYGASSIQTFNVYLDGTALFASDIQPASDLSFSTYSTTFTTTAGTHTLKFLGTDTHGGDQTAVVDNVTITSATTIPAAPTNLTATAGSAQLTLGWVASSGATSYNIYRGTTSGGEVATPIATGITATTYTDTGLTNGTIYYYKVTAVNAAGESGRSNEASATPTSGVTIPAAPTSLAATAGSTHVALTWSASSGATSYNIYRGTAAGGESATAIVTNVTGTSYINTGLTNGTTYYYKVTAVNTAGESARSNEAFATPTGGGGGSANYTFADSHIVKTGVFTPAFTTYENMGGPNAQIDFVATGTSLTVAYQTGSSTALRFTVDGTATTPTLTADNAVHTASVFSGLTDTAHRVTIKTLGGNPYLALTTTTMLTLTGSAPSLGLPDAAHAFPGQPDLTGTFYIFNNSAFNAHARISPGWFPSTLPGVPVYYAGWEDSIIQFKMQTTSGVPWSLAEYYADSGSLHDCRVFVDNVSTGLIADNVLSYYGYQQLASGVGDGAEHDVQIVMTNTATGSVSFHYGMSLKGATQDQAYTYPAQDTWAGYGDSITAANTTGQPDSTIGFLWKLHRDKGVQIANRGIGGSSVIASGQSRTADITGLSPAPTKVIVLYGTNDMNGSTTVTPGFQAAYYNMMNSLTTALPSTKFYVMSLLPRYDESAAGLTAWNNTILAAIGSGGDGATHVLTAAQKAQITYVDSSTINLNNGGSDYSTYYFDGPHGVHPNDAGYNLIENKLITALGG